MIKSGIKFWRDPVNNVRYLIFKIRGGGCSDEKSGNFDRPSTDIGL